MPTGPVPCTTTVSPGVTVHLSSPCSAVVSAHPAPITASVGNVSGNRNSDEPARR